MIVTFYGYLPAAVELIARAGGGGSNNGGGVFILLIGYVPMHFLGAIFRRVWKENLLLKIILQVVGWITAVIFALFLATFGGIGMIIGFGALAGMGAGLYGWFGSVIRQSKKAKQALGIAAKNDSAWQEDTLVAHVKDTFIKFQNDWSQLSYEPMKNYLTPSYYQHAALMVAALKQMGRRNSIVQPKIEDVTIVDLVDSQDNNQDQVIVGISASADDQLIDIATNTMLFEDTSSFTEYWRFRRSGNEWLLDGIQQASENKWKHNQALEDFASRHNYYFSLDWGWLLLPRRGQLFQKGKFGSSDINNHVIGIYNQYLLQIYTYNPNPDDTSSDKYLIAQTNVPKNYGEIVVRRKKMLQPFGVHGLNKISMEWQDFNKKYEVFASNAEQVTAFELLHPAFMEKLEALPFEVNINVVDNVIYLYTKTNTDPQQYETMLTILQEAYKQMKL